MSEDKGTDASVDEICRFAGDGVGFCGVCRPIGLRAENRSDHAQIGEPLSVIAKDRANVMTLIGEGVDPHLYRLTRDAVRLNRADLVL